MTYIEGIGDDVLLALGAVLVLIALVLLWVSTSVNEAANRQVVVLDRQRFQRLLLRFGIARNRMVRHHTHVSNRRVSPNSTQQAATSSRTQQSTDGQEPETNPNRIPNATDSREASAQPVHAAQQTSSSQQVSCDPNTPPNSSSELPRNSDNVNSLQDNESSDFDLSSTRDVPAGQAASDEENIAAGLPAQSSRCDTNSDDSEKKHNESSDTSGNSSENGTTISDAEPLEAQEGDIDTMRKLRMAFLERQKNTTSILTDNENVHENSDNSINVSNQPSNNSNQNSETGAESENLGSHRDSTGQETESVQEATEESSNADETEELREGHIRVRIRYMDARQHVVQSRPQDTISQFKRVHFANELADNTRVRLIYRGQELKDENRTLQEVNIQDNSAVHCLLSRMREDTSGHQPETEEADGPVPDIGFLVLPLFGFILGMVWYCRVQYRQYFNAMSTLSLMGITFLYLIALLASRTRAREHHEHQD